MYFKTIQSAAVKSVFEVLKDIINDVNIYASSEGLRILTLDTARAALVDTFLYADNFEEYSCPTETVIGVNITNLFKLLKTISHSDVLECSVRNKDALHIKIYNVEKHTSTEFELKLLDIDEDRLEPPESGNANRMQIPSSDFQRICRDMGNIATEVEITRQDKELIISCDGDFAKQKTVITYESDSDISTSGTYSLKYLNLFTKATSMSSVMFINQGQDNKIIILNYSIANLGHLHFYLAAKVTDE